ncbi:MAG: large conductance mechanosensitive channel protein MscL [Alphaproteobacteria bacterium]
MLKEFKEFIARGNVMDMAVGIIIGAAFTAIVKSMVGDLIMPFIGVITAGIDFGDLYYALDGNTYATLAAAEEAGVALVKYGAFVNALINFLIVAFVVFLLVKGVNSLKRKAEDPKAKDAPKPAADIVLLTEIRDALQASAAKPAAKKAAPKAAAKKTTAKKAPTKKAAAKKK